jgi:hypothetical protein
MTASRKTVEDIYEVLTKYVPADKVARMLIDLRDVDGNASFRATVLAIAQLHIRRSS